MPREAPAARLDVDAVAAAVIDVIAKAIAPLAPSANAERFADAAKVEKWFRRNCNDVLGRTCTPSEKADVMAYLLK